MMQESPGIGDSSFKKNSTLKDQTLGFGETKKNDLRAMINASKFRPRRETHDDSGLDFET